MSDFNIMLRKIMQYVFSGTCLPDQKIDDCSCAGIHMLELDENRIFIERNAPLEYIYIFASGVAYVVSYTQDGRRIIADTFTEPQIFGLVEAVNGDIHYRGTVVTLSKSLVFKIDRVSFLQAVYSNLELSSMIIKYLANLSIHTMKVSENMSARSPYDNLIIYLYNKSLGKKLPYRLKDNKSFIADSLQINKRSLYRYLNLLCEQGIIDRERQDIIINEHQLKKIESLFNTINDL